MIANFGSHSPESLRHTIQYGHKNFMAYIWPEINYSPQQFIRGWEYEKDQCEKPRIRNVWGGSKHGSATGFGQEDGLGGSRAVNEKKKTVANLFLTNLTLGTVIILPGQFLCRLLRGAGLQNRWSTLCVNHWSWGTGEGDQQSTWRRSTVNISQST